MMSEERLCDGGLCHIFLSLKAVKIYVLLLLINVGTTTKQNLVVLQQTTTNYKLSDWAHFWNVVICQPYLAFCRSKFPFLRIPFLQKAEIAVQMSLGNKKKYD